MPTYSCEGGETQQFVIFFGPPGYHITQVHKAPYTGLPGGTWVTCGTESYTLSPEALYVPGELGLPEPTGAFLPAGFFSAFSPGE